MSLVAAGTCQEKVAVFVKSVIVAFRSLVMVMVMLVGILVGVMVHVVLFMMRVFVVFVMRPRMGLGVFFLLLE